MKADVRTTPSGGAPASSHPLLDTSLLALHSRSTPAHIIASGIVALLLLHLFLAPVTSAQSGGPYDLTWSTVDGGGGTFSTGGGYRLGSTAGQPDSGLCTGGPYTLGGGFWGGGPTTVIVYDYDTYLPLVVRDAP